MKSALQKTLKCTATYYHLTLLVTLLALSLFYFAGNLGRFYAFSHRWPFDFSLFNKVFYNFVNHFSFSATHDLTDTFMRIHFVPITVLLSPLYLLYQGPVMMSFMPVVMVSVTGFFIAKNAEFFFKDKRYGLLFLFIFLAYPGTWSLYQMGFRYSIVAMMFLSVGLFAYLQRRYWLFVLSLFLTLLCKESSALMVAGFGILPLVQRRSTRWWVVPFTFGAGYFYLVNGIVMPQLRQSQDFGGNNFNNFFHLGKTPQEIAKNLILSPANTFQLLTTENNLKFYWELLGRLWWLPLLGLEYLLPATGIMLLTTLSNKVHTATTASYHYAPMVPFLFFALAVGLQRFFSVVNWLLQQKLAKIDSQAKKERTALLQRRFKPVFLSLFSLTLFLMLTGFLIKTTGVLAQDVKKIIALKPFYAILDGIEPAETVAAGNKIFAFVAHHRKTAPTTHYSQGYGEFGITKSFHSKAVLLEYGYLILEKQPATVEEKTHLKSLRLALENNFAVLYFDGERMILRKDGQENPTAGKELRAWLAGAEKRLGL